ncbi:MAG: FecR family protein [Agriterribacter sp.]
MEYAANDKIDQLLVKFLAKETTPAEEQEMLSWVESSEENLRYFHQFSLVWHESAATKQVAPNEKEAWQKFMEAANIPGAKTRVVNLRWLRMVAAVFIIAAGISVLYIVNKPAGQQIFSQAVNQVKKDTLPDNSIITLNKGAALSYPAAFKGDQRKVQLKGEAFFEIEPDKTKPFIIDVADIEVKVVGTSFNIKNNDSLTEIIVSTGIVQVTHNNKTVELKKGEQAVITASGNRIQKTNSTDQLFNYYVSHTFVCDNTPLWKLVDKLNEAYGVNITIARKELRAIPLTVTFNDESLNTILDVLSQTLMLKITKDDNNIILQ